MTVKVAINGFGRIGRQCFASHFGVRPHGHPGRRHQRSRPGRDERASDALRFSVHGRFPGTVTVDGDTIDVGFGPIKVTAIRNPAELPHKALGVDIALECTGIFT